MMEDGAELNGILAQWQRERPDLDTRCMLVCGAVWRAGRRLMDGLKENLDRYGLDFPGLDVLLTLRRNGRDAALSPSEMAADMMLSAGAMTARLDKLEKRGLIARQPDPQDRRGVRIILTDAGFDLSDALVPDHVAAEEAMLAPLTKEERRTLTALLSKIATDVT